MRVLSSVLAFLALLPCAAQASTVIASNPTGGEILLEQVLTQRTRPLFAATRSPGGTFTPLRALTPPRYFDDQQVALDDAGDAMAVWTQFEPDGFPDQVWFATRPPGRRFSQPRLLFRGGIVEPPLLTLNARGDAIVVWRRDGKPTMYSFRPARGTFSRPVPIAGVDGADAIALDGDGGAFLMWWDPPEGVKASYRPPGGSFGPAQVVAGFYPAAATDGDGDMLLAWRQGDALMAAERRAGSASFDAPSVVASGLRKADAVDALAVSPGGDATVGYGRSPLELATRHGGVWSPPQALAVGNYPESFQIRMNRRGDAALSWATVDRAVHAAYRPAGAAFGAPRQLSKARPFAPGGDFVSTSLAIDGSGRATVTWEESDGAHVSVYARDFNGNSTAARVRVGRFATYRREGPPSACRPSWARVLKSTPRATLLAGTRGDAKGRHYGCLLARGATVDLFTEYGMFPPVAFAGPLVGYASDDCDPDECNTFISVTDLRDEGDGVNRGWVLPTSEVPALVLRSNGAVAWVSCLSFDVAYGKITDCTAKSHKRKRVYALDRHSFRPRLLAVSRRIAPQSLSLHGSRLTWRDGRKLRAARLR